MIYAMLFLSFVFSEFPTRTTPIRGSQCPDLTYESLVGSWYGDHKLDKNSYQRWLMKRFENGYYEVTIEYTDLNTSEVAIEKHQGLWSYSKCLYSTHSLEMNDKPERHSTIYIVSELDKNTFKYQSTATGLQYSVTKVDDDFELNSSN